MRTKAEILDSTERNAKKATGPVDISLIHSLHTLEVIIDIRDILDKLMLELYRGLRSISKQN